MSTFSRIGKVVAACCLAVAALSACSTVAPQVGVEEQIKTQLGADSATCPGDLDGTVGSTLTCSATGGGETFDVTATVTSVEGGTINFDIERVGAAPATTAGPTEEATTDTSTGAVDGQEVAASVSEQLTALAGRQPDSVTCPDLPATVGSAIRCELVAGADTLGVTVTTSSVEGGRVQFDIKVDETPS